MNSKEKLNPKLILVAEAKTGLDGHERDIELKK